MVGPQAAPATTDRLRTACLAADLDHDNYVSLDVFHQHVVIGGNALPADPRGYVFISQLSAVPGMPRGLADRLKAADADADGKLSFREVVTARMAYFDAADANRDDRLLMQECADHQRKLQAASGRARK